MERRETTVAIFKRLKSAIPDQKDIKRRIGENEPEKYIEFFGEVEEG